MIAAIISISSSAIVGQSLRQLSIAAENDLDQFYIEDWAIDSIIGQCLSDNSAPAVRLYRRPTKTSVFFDPSLLEHFCFQFPEAIVAIIWNPGGKGCSTLGAIAAIAAIVTIVRKPSLSQLSQLQ